MIDIHNHILPGLDDGAQDIYDTLEMIKRAEESGITAIVATPHCNVPGFYKNYFGEKYIETIQKVRKAAKEEGLPVKILPGVEAFGTTDLPRLLQDGKVMPLNQSRYLLMEFYFDEDPEFVNYLLEEVTNLKAIPVIAHAERYKFVQRDPNLVYHWRNQGYPVQINKGSLQGRFGSQAQRTVKLLLDHYLVSVVASDAHGPYRRTPNMIKAHEQLSMEYPESYVNMLFYENPRRICKNEPILGIAAKRIE